MSGHFDILTGFPPDVLAVSGHGRIDRACYEDTLIPAIEAVLKAEGKVKLLYMLGADFEGFTAGAVWGDARLGLLHQHDFARIAVVTDEDWLRTAAKLFSPLIRAPFRAFPLAEYDAAKAWIADNTPPDHGGNHGSNHGGNVDATRRILPLEDKTPR